MSDIPKLFRGFANAWISGRGRDQEIHLIKDRTGCHLLTTTILWDGADEIDRLKAQNEELLAALELLMGQEVHISENLGPVTMMDEHIIGMAHEAIANATKTLEGGKS